MSAPEPLSDEQAAEDWRNALGVEEIPVVGAAKRCGVQWTPWMGDWFTSWSPRNDNNNAEGTWEHWVNLALGILQDEMTASIAPEVFVAAHHYLPRFDPKKYADSDRLLSETELRARFEGDE